MWLENIFYQTVVCFFICITLLFKDQKFQFINFHFLDHVFGVKHPKSLPNSKSRILPMFFSLQPQLSRLGPWPTPSSRCTLWKVQTYRRLVLVWLSCASRFRCFNTVCRTTSAFPVDLLLLTFCSWIARWCQSVDGMCVGLFLDSPFYSTDIRSVLSHSISHYMFTTTFEIR